MKSSFKDECSKNRDVLKSKCLNVWSEMLLYTKRDDFPEVKPRTSLKITLKKQEINGTLF